MTLKLHEKDLDEDQRAIFLPQQDQRHTLALIVGCFRHFPMRLSH